MFDSPICLVLHPLLSSVPFIHYFPSLTHLCIFFSYLLQKRSAKTRSSSAGRRSRDVWNLWPRCLSQSEPTTSPGAMTLTVNSRITLRPPFSNTLKSPSPSSQWSRLSPRRPRSRPFRSRRRSPRRQRCSTARHKSRALPPLHSSSSRSLLTCCALTRLR